MTIWRLLVQSQSNPLNHNLLQSICPCTPFHKSLWTKVSAKQLLAYTCIVSLYASCHGQFTALVEFLSQICLPYMLCFKRDQYGPQGNIPAGRRIVVTWVFLSREPPQDHPTWERWRCLINHISSSSPERQVQFNWTKTHFSNAGKREKRKRKGAGRPWRCMYREISFSISLIKTAPVSFFFT